MPWDFEAIVERGRADLVRLLALLVAMVGSNMSPMQYRAVLRQLRPLESALRRVIAIAARDVTAAPRAKSIMPIGGIPNGSRAHIGVFPLFDPRPEIGVRTRYAPGPGPQIRTFDEPPRPDPAPASGQFDLSALKRRLDRIARALDRIPLEAKRLARWRSRNPNKLKRPMRPGRPPGQIRRGHDDPFQSLLQDIHFSALFALEPG